MTDVIHHRLAKLARTLSFLQERSPFYRTLIQQAEAIDPAVAPEVLRTLPILDSIAWDECRLELRTDVIDEAATGFTNGTTGLPKPFYITASETESLEAGFDRDTRRRLNLISVNHGVAASLWPGVSTSYIPLISPRYCELAARIIAQDGPAFEGPPVRIVGGTLPGPFAGNAAQRSSRKVVM